MVSLRALTTDGSLNLRVLSGAENLDRGVITVHATEHLDPTPWLAGGELLMSDFLMMGSDADWVSYVQRLNTAGVAGLAFGVGQPHAEVPTALINAADAVGFPVFRVPPTTAFIAITGAVFNALAEERAAASIRSLEAQRRLIASSMSGATVAELLEELRLVVAGNAVITDPRGGLIAAAPPNAEGLVALVREDLDRFRRLGLKGSASVLTADSSSAMMALPLGAEAVRGYLVCSFPRSESSDFVRNAVGSAAALITAEMENRRTMTVAERKLDVATLTVLLESRSPSRTRDILDMHKFPAGPIRLLVVKPSTHQRSVLDSLFDLLPAALIGTRDSLIIAMLPASVADLVDVLRDVPNIAGAGVGRPVQAASIHIGLRQATRALITAEAHHRQVVDASDLGYLNFLLDLAPRDALSAYSESALGPLESWDSTNRASLLGTLRVYLECDAVSDTAARRLGLHRNTIRQHLEKIETATGRRLTHLDDLVELSTAVHIRDLLLSESS
jgi:purine catabolism regulator